MNKLITITLISTTLMTLPACSTLDQLLKGKNSVPPSPQTSGPLAPTIVAYPDEINRRVEAKCSPASLSALAASLPEAAQQAAIKQQVITFATDKSDLASETTGVLAAHAQLLLQHQRVQLNVTGHTDERGTADYNLALGERRANAVATFLAAAGVMPSQLQVISYGEEKPVALGSDEASWSQNRRVELTYSGCE